MHTPQATDALTGLWLDHVEFYVGDARASASEYVEKYGFRVVAKSPDGVPAARRVIAVGQGDIVMILTEGRDDEDPARTYVQEHGDGVANIALGTSDARAAFAEAVARGARPVAQPVEQDGCVTAVIGAFGDVVHTFVQRTDDAAGHRWPGLVQTAPVQPGEFGRLDHFAICLPAGELEPTVAYYEQALGFQMIFQERILVGAQAMNSKVVQSQSRDITLTLIEPDTSHDPGQIDFFVKEHGGAGVQHIAFTSENIVASVTELRRRGVAFLTTPDAYYELLGNRLQPQSHTIDELRAACVLADADHDGQLFQIFTRSAHPRRTFFLEVIERLGARTFGSGNIKALYEAVELEQTR